MDERASASALSSLLGRECAVQVLADAAEGTQGHGRGKLRSSSLDPADSDHWP